MSSTQPLMPARYATRAAFTGIANASVSALAAVLALPLLVATLGVDSYAKWAALGMFITGGAALDLGMARALVLHCAAQPLERVREITTAAASIAAGIAAFAILVIASAGALRDTPSGAIANVVTPSVLTAGCCVLALGMLNGVMRAVLESQLAVHWVNLGYLLQTLLVYGLTLLAAVFWPQAVLPATVCAFAAVSVFNMGMLARLGLLAPRRPARATFHSLLSSAWHSCLLSAPIAVLPPLASFIALNLAASAAAFAMFDLAQRIATLAAILLSSIAVPILAIAARTRAAGEPEAALDRLTLRYLAFGWSLFAAGMLVYGIAGEKMLAWVFPAAGSELFPVAGALLAGMGAIAASEAVVRRMLGGTDVNPLFWGRIMMLALIGVAGILATRFGGLKIFTSIYAIAGIACSVFLLTAWRMRVRGTALQARR